MNKHSDNKFLKRLNRMENEKNTSGSASDSNGLVRREVELSNSNYAKIKHGKRTTIRLGQKDYKLGPIDIVSDFGEITKAEILEVRLVRFGDLGLSDAIADGFNSTLELQIELEQCYQTFVSPADPVTQVRFKLI